MKEARRSPSGAGRSRSGSGRSTRFAGPVTTRHGVGLALGRRRSPEIISFVEEHFGRRAHPQNLVMGAEIVAFADEKEAPHESLRAPRRADLLVGRVVASRRRMSRPDDRPLRRLTDARRAPGHASRNACSVRSCAGARAPVSNAEPRETLHAVGEDVDRVLRGARGRAAGAVLREPGVGLHGVLRQCRASCDHENDVAGTLLDARAALVSAKLGPEGAHRTIAGFGSHRDATQRGVRELCTHHGVRADSRDALLVGCGYVRGARAEAKHAIERSQGAHSRGPVALVEQCCGLPLLLAGGCAGVRAAS